MVATASRSELREAEQVAVRIVDCDVHLVPQSKAEILERMPEPWRSRIGKRRANANGKATYTSYELDGRMDSRGTSGLPGGSEPDLVYKQLFEEASVDLAMLVPAGRYTVDPQINASWCRANNQWVADTWLDKWNLGGRFFGAINVTVDDPQAAAREIEHWAGHPGFKQVILGDISERPLGLPMYDPVWEAASRHRLPVAMHFAGHGANSLGSTPVGSFPRHVEYHSVAYPLVYVGHLLSWITGGVFDRFPEFRFAFLEGGFLWHRPVIARLARHWAEFGAENDASKRDPFDYVREHVRFATQPIEEHEQAPEDVARLMELAEANRTLMFSSDYPHYDFDHPLRALPKGLSKETRQRVMFENACEFYDLPRTRPSTSADLDGVTA
jgi:predicted TIM-barrel fold metal-dependent hydrolase